MMQKVNRTKFLAVSFAVLLTGIYAQETNTTKDKVIDKQTTKSKRKIPDECKSLIKNPKTKISFYCFVMKIPEKAQECQLEWLERKPEYEGQFAEDIFVEKYPVKTDKIIIQKELSYPYSFFRARCIDKTKLAGMPTKWLSLKNYLVEINPPKVKKVKKKKSIFEEIQVSDNQKILYYRPSIFKVDFPEESNVWYKENEKPLKPWPGKIQLSPEEQYHILFFKKTTDKKGKPFWIPLKKYNFLHDADAPETGFLFQGKYLFHNGIYYVSRKTKLFFHAKDSLSPIKKIHVELIYPEKKALSQKIEFPIEDGAKNTLYKIQFYSEDVIGNQELVKNMTVYYDVQAPICHYRKERKTRNFLLYFTCKEELGQFHAKITQGDKVYFHRPLASGKFHVIKLPVSKSTSAKGDFFAKVF
ncbi:MAG: hypothetical protein D6767_09135 [Candidatus Hydrogenedentota bacterium]|nr:MAG: hypothetical protein D6767_09135 [Candidatus Hydrogenedentota bacterium]